MLFITFDFYHLNQSRTRPGPEHYLCYRARLGPVQTSASQHCASQLRGNAYGMHLDPVGLESRLPERRFVGCVA
jgi:hypothetical protein